jgi:hypothetical protein
MCHYLAVRCLLEARELSEALQVLTDGEREGILFPNMCTSFDSSVPPGFDEVTPNVSQSHFGSLITELMRHLLYVECT